MSGRRFLRVALGVWLLAVSTLALGVEPVMASGETFQRGVLDFSVSNPTSLAFGPDGRLYVASLGQINALMLDPAGQQVLSVETIASGQTSLLGIAFDPTAPSPISVYASRQEPSAADSYEGRVSRYTAPAWTRQDVITGLPSSAPFSNHFTNGLAFNGQGRLFIAQGSNTDAGLSGPYWPETPLSAAILTADIHAPSFDGSITYSPSTPPTDDNVDQTGGGVTVYAAGLRNPYDLALHSNGLIYATDNGPMGGTYSLTCSTSSSARSTSDELDLIEQGNYYGHPNRNRGRSDPRQCTYHAPAEGSGTTFTGPIASLPSHCSCDGIAEYTAPAFGGVATGDFLIAQFVSGELSVVKLSGDGRSVVSNSTLASNFDSPLDVAVGATGTVYVAEFGGMQVSFLAPKGAVGGLAAAPDLAARPPGRNVGLLLALGAAVVAAVGVAGAAFRRWRTGARR